MKLKTKLKTLGYAVVALCMAVLAVQFLPAWDDVEYLPLRYEPEMYTPAPVFAPVPAPVLAKEGPVPVPFMAVEHAAEYPAMATAAKPSDEPIYIVGIADGVIAVFHAMAEEGKELRELTTTPIGAITPEERHRLSRGIPIYSEEQLLRILQDYGS